MPPGTSTAQPPTIGRGWILTAKNLVFPQFCQACHARLLTEENGYFCPTCWELSPRIERPFCPRCGRPHEGAVGLGTRANFLCADCREQPPEHVRRIYGAARYTGAVREAIVLFKFLERRRLCDPLAELLADVVTTEMDPASYDILTPVPLHRVRERARGYNQSRLLAEAVQPLFPRAVLANALRRHRPTRAQSRLHTAKREKNVRGAFQASGECVHTQTVLLVDDVVTTGSTVNACADTLLRAGAAAVDVLTVAIARV
ncbi:MAG: ComF family protein [Candidatus Hydrogenedentota bacterium]